MNRRGFLKGLLAAAVTAPIAANLAVRGLVNEVTPALIDNPSVYWQSEQWRSARETAIRQMAEYWAKQMDQATFRHIMLGGENEAL